MSILVNKNTRVLTQGITGATGQLHTRACKEYGTQMVGGVVPGKGGTDFESIPIFDTVEQARKSTGCDATVIYVPPAFAADAILEAGDIGVVSRSGTLTYEAVYQLTQLGIGQSTCIGIGGDPIVGTTHVDALKLFNEDPKTKAVIMIGEIGGTAEEEAGEYIKQNFKKPVVAFIAGQTAPKGRRMGHAGAIISGGRGTAADKIAALKAAGITVAMSPADLGTTMKSVLEGKK